MKHNRIFPLLLIMAALALPTVLLAGDPRTDESLNIDFFHRMLGLDGLDGQCCYNGTNQSCGVADDAGVCADDESGEVGVSQFITNDKALVMAGSVQPSFDNGQDCNCARKAQTYTIVNRSNQSFPGLTNTMIGLCICASNTGDCNCNRKWSTMYAGPRLPVANIDEIYNTADEAERTRLKNVTGILFPETTGGWMIWHALAPSPDKIQARYMALLDTNDPETEDIINVTQYVYKPNGKPYFDVTWKIDTLKENPNLYRRAKFWHAVDTFTGGNDFGFGYLCDITKICGGTGGTSFFQGTIAFHPSERQYEGWWASVFDKVKNDDLPDFTWSEPLGAGAMSAGIDLTALDDNATAHEWDGLSLGPSSKYVSIRWTYDDPILRSSYGSTRSLFRVSGNDLAYYQDSGDEDSEVDVSPTLYDVNFNPRYWRGAVYAYRLPLACKSSEDCESGDDCLPDPACTAAGGSGCATYCASSFYSQAQGCPDGQDALFGYCVVRKWKTEDMDNYLVPDDGRRIFTFDTTGKRYWFNESNAANLAAAFGTDSAKASDIIKWTLGTLNIGSNTGDKNTFKIIPSNTSHDYDLHRPLNPDALASTPSTILELMRERYSETEGNSWLLGDISHADPIYIGSRPSNGWSDDNLGNRAYSRFFNSKVYQRRQPVLLVAANDGILHCYDGETGVELWGFAAWDVLANFPDLVAPIYEQLRTPMMDLRPVVHDAFDSTAGQDKWRTVLMLGSRGGGDTYWAMELTPHDMHLTPDENLSATPDPNAQDRLKFLWYYTDDDLGLTYSIPTSGRFRTSRAEDNFNFEWLVFFGSGYGRHSPLQMQKEGYFYTLNMFGNNPSTTPKATLVSKIKIDASGISTMSADEGTVRNNVLSSATVMDNGVYKGSTWDHTDQDGFEDVVYIGDLAGHLLRFSVLPPSSGTGLSVVGHVLFNSYKTGASGSEAMDDYLQVVENPRLASMTGQADIQKYDFHKYPRPISVRPVVWRTDKDPDEGGAMFLGKTDNYQKTMVYAGTGKYDAFYDSFDRFRRNPNDPNSIIDHQHMFAVIDWNYPTVDNASRVKWSELLANTVDDSGEVGGRKVRTIVGGNPDSGWRGWKMRFESSLAENAGEKVITEPVVWEQQDRVNLGDDRKDPEWILFFTTFTPNMEGTCDIRTVEESGGGYVMSVRAIDGQNPSFAIQDVSGDTNISDADQSAGKGYAGQKFTGSVLSAVQVDPYTNTLYVKTGPDQPVIRLAIAGLNPLKGIRTSFVRIR